MTGRDQFEKRLRAEGSRPAPPALEEARRFLRVYVFDSDSTEEVQGALERKVQRSRRETQRTLDAFEAVLADPPTDGSILRMVALDVNTHLGAQMTHDGCLAYLSDLATLLHDALDGGTAPSATSDEAS